MNIGYFNARGINDVEHWFKLEIDELVKRGHDVRVFTSNPKYGNQPNNDDLDWMDIAHFHFAQVANQYKRLGVPFIISPHANDIWRDNGATLMKASRHPKCKFVTYQSFYHKKKFEEWGINKPLVYLPMCCRTELFKRIPSIHLGNKIIAGGRLIPKKGLDKLKNIDNLIIFGDGPLKEELEVKLPRAEFVGWKEGEELKKIYEKGYLFLNPCIVTSDGDSDGISNTIKEAMLMELQVISSPVAGIPELEQIHLLDDWSNIGEVIKGYSMVPNKKGRQEILRTYSPDVTVNMLLKAINKYG